MIIGLTSDQYRKIPIHYILSALRWVGVRYSEVTCNIFSNPVRALRAGRNMKLGLHLPTLGSVGHDFSHLSFKIENENILDLLGEWGGRFDFAYGVIHPPEGRAKEISVDYFFKNIRRIALPLLLENIPQWPLKKFIDFYHDVRKGLPSGSVHLCLDIPHAYLSDGEWLPFFKAHHNEIKLVHLSNCAEGEDWHYPFQVHGDLELIPVLEHLKTLQFQGLLNLELYPHEPAHIRGILNSFIQATEYTAGNSCHRLRTRAKALSYAGGVVVRIMQSLFRHSPVQKHF